jgi:hypothetical protein
MAGRFDPASPVVQARVVGLLNVVTLAAGTFAGFVHGRLVVPGDAATTASRIAASEPLFRLGIVSALAMYVVFAVSVCLLYPLLAPAGRNLAIVMAVLALLGVPIAMLNQVHQSAALMLLSGADHLRGFGDDERRGLVMLFLDLHRQGNLVGVIFWGLWLFPLGLLVHRSGFFPRTLGVLLMVGCLGWLVVFIQRFFLPAWQALTYARYAAHVAELSWTLWLLVRGVDRGQWDRRATTVDSSVGRP